MSETQSSRCTALAVLSERRPKNATCPQPAFGGPFHESDLSDEFGPGPYERAHLFRQNPAVHLERR